MTDPPPTLKDQGRRLRPWVAPKPPSTMQAKRERAHAQHVPARLPSRLSLAVVAMAALLVACGGPPSAPSLDSALARAQELSGKGDLVGAAFVLRNAMVEHGNALALLEALAENQLAQGRPDLALTTLRRAEQSGATQDQIAELRAWAYYDMGDARALDALAAITTPGGRARFSVDYYRGRAAVESANVLPGVIFDRFFELFLEQSTLSPADRDALGRSGILEELEALLQAQPEVARAKAHVDCASADPPVLRWIPAALDPTRRVLRVGPGEDFPTVAAAASSARDGDVVEIVAGDYPGDVAIWRQNGLLVRGVNGRPHISAAGRRVAERDVWLFKGNDIVVENVEISGARSPAYHNGAAIRHVGTHLTLRHVFLHDSENGVLTGKASDSKVLVEYSEFGANGYRDGKSHNLYIGKVDTLDFRYNYSHDSHAGHLLKSRARVNSVLYNRFSDERGDGSYLVDAANGGRLTMIGNVLEQGANTQNNYAVSYAAEGLLYDENELTVVHNSLYNRAFQGGFVRLHTRTRTRIVNNIAIGAPTGLVSTDYIYSVKRGANLTATDHGLRSPARFDFSLTFGSRAIDGGEVVAPAATREYVHPVGWRERQSVERPDIGAYEACRGKLAQGIGVTPPTEGA